MSTLINIKINDTPLEVEIEGETPEPANGIQGGYDIIAVYVSRTIKKYDVHLPNRTEVIKIDIWPIIADFMEQEIVEKIEELWRSNDNL